MQEYEERFNQKLDNLETKIESTLTHRESKFLQYMAVNDKILEQLQKECQNVDHRIDALCRNCGTISGGYKDKFASMAFDIEQRFNRHKIYLVVLSFIAGGKLGFDIWRLVV